MLEQTQTIHVWNIVVYSIDSIDYMGVKWDYIMYVTRNYSIHGCSGK